MDVIKDIINNIYNNYKLSIFVLLALLMCSFDNDLKSMLDPVIFKDARVYPILMGLTVLVYLITWLLFCWWFFLNIYYYSTNHSVSNKLVSDDKIYYNCILTDSRKMFFWKID